MAVKGTPTGGLAEIAERVYINGADFTLVAYTNTPNSLGSSTVAADLVQPTAANGYAPIVLNGTWSHLNGVISYDHGGGSDPEWIATGTWSAVVTGVAMIVGTKVEHFFDLPTSWTAAIGRKLRVAIRNLIP